jgi:hypothetical protein
MVDNNASIYLKQSNRNLINLLLHKYKSTSIYIFLIILHFRYSSFNVENDKV